MEMTKRMSLTAQAYKGIRDDILACRLVPGQKLNIAEVCERLNFSLGAVREALSRLTSEGLVVSEPNKGFRVAPITQEELEDLTRTRILIECECLKNAMRHGDLKWETGIVSTLFELSRVKLQDPDDPQRVNAAWVETHRRFHERLVATCDSAWLLRLREILYVQAERYRSVSVPLDRAHRDIESEHRAIADAAMAGDADAACAAMRDHLTLTTRILIDAAVTSRSRVKLEETA
jgi:GntR family carbon starvation induced transcriptional regulator